ncbi:family 16 glycosylhydrolase [bacterium]|nr:family 16 glycosylhydrolase [bacterium]
MLLKAHKSLFFLTFLLFGFVGTATAAYEHQWTDAFSVATSRWEEGTGALDGSQVELTPDNVSFSSGLLTVALTEKSAGSMGEFTDRPYWGGEYSTVAPYAHGRFLVTMQPAAPSGVVSEIVLQLPAASTDSAQIAIRFLGRTDQVQYHLEWKDSIGTVHTQDASVDLGFDAAAAQHHYMMEWTSSHITFFVDGFYSHAFVKPSVLDEFQADMEVRLRAWIPESSALAGAFDPASLPLQATFDAAFYFEWQTFVSSATVMGAYPHSGGTTFRVWAPNADSVHVRGTFNGWGLSNPLSREAATGYWSTFVSGASAGDEYKFYVTNNSPSAGLDTTVWQRDPYSRRIASFQSPGDNSVVYDPNAFDWEGPKTFVPEPREKLIIYEMHVGTFNAPSGAPATFYEAIGRLDQLVDLGINTIEVMPVQEVPSNNGWGYDPVFYNSVELGLGEADAFKAFVKACHERNLAVLVDVVYNHTTTTRSPLWQFDLWYEQDGGGIWFYNDAYWQTTPWGPRMDFRRPEVREFIKQNIRTYLDEFRVDGFRFDATRIMREVVDENWDTVEEIEEALALLQEISAMIDREYPDAISTAEDFGVDQLASLDLGSNGAGFDAEWGSFKFYAARALVASDSARDLDDLRRGMERTINGDPMKRVVYVESHDSAATEDPDGETFPYRGGYLPKRLNQIDPETNITTRKLSMLGSVFTFTLPGVPMMFMGQEAYATGTFDFPSPPALDWDQMLGDHPGIFQLHQDLIDLRLNHGGATRGLQGPALDVYHQNGSAKVIAYLRQDVGGAADDVVVVMNLSSTTFNLGYKLGMPEGGTWHVRFNSDLTSYDPAFGTSPGELVSLDTTADGRDGYPQSVKIPVLQPYTALILSQDAVSPREIGWMLR